MYLKNTKLVLPWNLGIFSIHSLSLPLLEIGDRQSELQPVHHLPVDARPIVINRHCDTDDRDYPPACRLLTLLPLLREETRYSAGNELVDHREIVITTFK